MRGAHTRRPKRSRRSVPSRAAHCLRHIGAGTGLTPCHVGAEAGLTGTLVVPEYRAAVSTPEYAGRQCLTLAAASIYSSLHAGKDGLGVRATFQARGAPAWHFPCAGALAATLHVRASLPGRAGTKPNEYW